MGKKLRTITSDDIGFTQSSYYRPGWSGFTFKKVSAIFYPVSFFDRTAKIHEIIRAAHPRVRMRTDKSKPAILIHKKIKPEELKSLVDTLWFLLTPDNY